MNLENFLAPVFIGRRHGDVPVKSSRTQKGRVENVGAVGRRNQNDAFLAFKSIEFDQDLIQGLLALIVPSADSRESRAAERVQFIDHNNGGGGFASLVK